MSTMDRIDTFTPITRRTDAAEVATAAYAQLLGLLESLGEDDWARPTDCTGWSVADMVGHLIGAARSNASMREMVRQQVWGARHRGDFGGNALDATNDLQVRDHAGLSPAERIARLRELVPAAVKGRMKVPAPLRAVGLGMPTGGSSVDGMPAKETMGKLMDVIYTRDVWLHTVDISRAAGREPDLGDPVNARIVADVAQEWLGRLGQGVALTLTGPAGGSFGAGGPELAYDAVEFCRMLSGRAPAEGPLATTRVVF